MYIIFVYDFRYEFICVSLVHPLFKREFISGPAKNRPGPLTRPDLVLNSSGINEIYIYNIYILIFIISVVSIRP